jgi:HEAT repeat protein
MQAGTLVPLDRRQRLLRKARAYLMDMETFLADTPVAVTVLLDVLPYAETDLILKIIPLLGYAGQDRVLRPLYKLMMEASGDEQVRRLAAVQLGLAASLSADPSVLKADLIENLSHREPSIRSNSALALGWEGNGSAVTSLMAHLADPNRDVQAAVVAALSSVGDVRVFELLTARLKVGILEERRCILLNLWRFAEQIPGVEDVYINCMEAIPTDLRVDALFALSMLPLSTTILEAYRWLLADEDPRIRRQVLENLAVTDPADYDPVKELIHLLLADKNAQVRQAAIRLLAMR